MKRLILTSGAGINLYRSDLADAVVSFGAFRFVWGPLPSPDELATFLAARSEAACSVIPGWSEAPDPESRRLRFRVRASLAPE
jgi:hypothetical protein